jgi:hypothetical protein
MNHTYVTDNQGTELPMGSAPNPDAAFHFEHVGNSSTGACVWRCCECRHGHLVAHRLTFTCFCKESSIRGDWTMGRLLFRQMRAHEAVAEWEQQLAIEHAQAA